MNGNFSAVNFTLTQNIMTTLYLTRHGETVDNANKILQGQTQGLLSPCGIEQAENLRDRMAATHLDAIVASDLRRAVDTAAIIAAPHGLPVSTTPLLRERDWGSFTGRYIPDLKDEPWPDDIETLEQLRARATTFLDMMQHEYAGQAVLAVGHGIINKAIQAVLFGKPMQEIARMENAEVRILRF